MRRGSVTIATTFLMLLAVGCGVPSYEKRLDKTLESMRYQKRLDENLAPAPTGGVYDTKLIYIRPPQKEAATKAFMLGAPEPGLFDVEVSFQGPNKDTLNLLARIKQPKKAAAKGAPPADAAPPATRGDFKSDVLNLIAGVYGVADDVQPGKLKKQGNKDNAYERLFFDTVVENAKTRVEAYFYKQDPYDACLIFVYPSGDAKMAAKVTLCLESFAVGPKARRAFSGLEEGEEGDEDSGPGNAF